MSAAETVPSTLDGGERAGPLHQVCGDEVLIDLPSVARVLVRGGAVAGVQAAPGTHADDVAWLLDGHVRQVAALQRGEFALRASAVTIDGRAVALCGRPAVGASALAAGLAQRGHPVLADGWLPVDAVTTRVEPVTSEIALWPDIAALVGAGEGRPVRPGLEKRRHAYTAGREAPLETLVVVSRYDWEAEASADLVKGGSALEQVLELMCQPYLAGPLGREGGRFAWAAALASRCAVHVLEIDRFRAGVEEPALAVERLVRG